MSLSLNWIDAVALALGKHGGGCHLNRLYDDAPRIYGSRPATFDSVVRQTLESRSSDSENFDVGKADLFTLPEGRGTGFWALRRLDWQLGDVVSEAGMLFLVFQCAQAFPSSLGNPAALLERVKTANLVEFAQQRLPLLPCWKRAP